MTCEMIATLPKRNRGRPRIDLSDDQLAEVERMARAQCRDGTIALAIGIDPVTFKRNFEAICAQKRAEGKCAIQIAQFTAAVQDRNPTMLIWLGKVYLGQSERGEPRGASYEFKVVSGIDLSDI